MRYLSRLVGGYRQHRLRYDGAGPALIASGGSPRSLRRVTARDNEVNTQWTPARQGAESNEMADTWAKPAADVSSYRGDRAYPRETSLSHMTRRETEVRPQTTRDRITERIRPDRLFRPPKGSRIRPQLRRERKAVAGRYFSSSPDTRLPAHTYATRSGGLRATSAGVGSASASPGSTSSLGVPRRHGRCGRGLEWHTDGSTPRTRP